MKSGWFVTMESVKKLSTALHVAAVARNVKDAARAALRYPLDRIEWMRVAEGRRRITRTYRDVHGSPLNAESARCFTGLLAIRMLEINRGGNALFTMLADKLAVRKYVAERVGESYLIPLLWQGVDPRQIPFDELTDTCIIKTNHGSGGNIVWRAGMNRGVVVSKVSRWLRENYYWKFREYHYFHIARRIIVEQFLDDGNDSGPFDYRFFCFGGEPILIQVDNNAHDIHPFYDVGWNRVSVRYRERFRDVDVGRPQNLDEMIAIARKLSTGLDFVRVDLYNVRGRIYFGEMTLTPMAGRVRIMPESWDRRLGDAWASARGERRDRN
ncbi:hypothetical protein K6W21_14480 [Burkholderia latens]|uniref:ATP-grasp fold amidoligase family protein n=1 Tax=Burkholderia latens TaxID=488446 RepID=UPI001C95E711|nr:ATP-grasp fold amidoligase family protein [Burkholderia latens]MBY4695279.1 hypothetical protein [Burkholderia latens]